MLSRSPRGKMGEQGVRRRLRVSNAGGGGP